MLNFSMEASVRFNRPIDVNKDYISPGGYVMKMKDSNFSFDFTRYFADVDEKDRTILHYRHINPDDSCFEDLQMLTEEHLKDIEAINEFFIFTGEQGETNLRPIKVESLKFYLEDKKETLTVKQSVLDNAQLECAI